MNIYIKKLFKNFNFNSSNIFNKEESYYDYNEKDTIIYRTIVEKLKNAELVSNEEYEYVHKLKYKVSSKEELRKIIEIYSEKNPTVSLNWIDTSLITNMSLLFIYSNYNGDISEWDTSNVIDMSEMFANTTKFNQSINDWDVSNVTNMEGMFCTALSFNQSIGDWNVSNVTNMSYMFIDAEMFNKDISKWDVSNVTTMESMFAGAISFNQEIGNWNVRKVTNMDFMFNDAVSFNKDISKWKLMPKIILNYTFINCPIKEEYKPNFKKYKSK